MLKRDYNISLAEPKSFGSGGNGLMEQKLMKQTIKLRDPPSQTYLDYLDTLRDWPR